MSDARDREAALDVLKAQARQGDSIAPADGAIDGAPLPAGAGPSYYGQPLLKAPVWTWEVPAYFVVGGIAGMSAMLAAVASFAGLDAGFAADARWVALAGSLVSPPLLISDLGRPARFLNMLRIVKPQSPMSVGAWTLVAFTGAVAGAVAARLLLGDAPFLFLALDAAGAALGLVLATYTGVLLGVSVVPVWAAHATRLPPLFAASSLGAAVSVLELLGHMTPAMNRLGFVAAAAELGILLTIRHASRDDRSAPIRRGTAGRLLSVADLIGVVIPLALRAGFPGQIWARAAAAVATVAGAVMLRYGWMVAGRASTADPHMALRRTLAVLVAAAVAWPGVADAQPARQAPQNPRAVAAAAARYVDDYRRAFAFLVADETSVHTRTAAGEPPVTRSVRGELFLTYLESDRAWIAVHDVADVDGVPVPDRDDVRDLLSRGTAIAGLGRRLAARNARFNLGGIERNFNEPTLALTLIEPGRVARSSFELPRVTRIGDVDIATLTFREREGETLIRGMTGRIRARGEVDVDVRSGAVRRTLVNVEDGPLTARLTTTYDWHETLRLWVPVAFDERYERRREPREVVHVATQYSNYRRFSASGRVKLRSDPPQ